MTGTTAAALFLLVVWSVIRVGISKETVNVCLVLESDSQFANYNRIQGVLDLAVVHANTYILPAHLEVAVSYHDAGLSCSVTPYSAVSVMMREMNNRTRCNVFLGAGKKAGFSCHVLGSESCLVWSCGSTFYKN